MFSKSHREDQQTSTDNFPEALRSSGLTCRNKIRGKRISQGILILHLNMATFSTNLCCLILSHEKGLITSSTTEV